MAKILIVGAGDVGGRLACSLAAAGHEVTALRRQPQALPG
ncbi:MAG: 2-dehydropantoate 2-reductase N-terminal domain-containing protein, partial [Perlucidibaca sp.]